MNLRETIIEGHCTCDTGAWGGIIPPRPCAYCRAVKAWKLGVRDEPGDDRKKTSFYEGFMKQYPPQPAPVREYVPPEKDEDGT